MEAHGRADAAHREQYAQLEAAGRLARLGNPEQIQIKDGKATVSFTIAASGCVLAGFGMAINPARPRAELAAIRAELNSQRGE